MIIKPYSTLRFNMNIWLEGIKNDIATPNMMIYVHLKTYHYKEFIKQNKFNLRIYIFKCIARKV